MIVVKPWQIISIINSEKLIINYFDIYIQDMHISNENSCFEIYFDFD